MTFIFTHPLETEALAIEVKGQVPKIKAETTSKKSSGHIVKERLPNGWIKKAVKRLSGISKGKWEVFLITPDQRILRTPGDLKLYIAKSGAIVDSNLVNFSLPKKTVKTDKLLSAKKAKEEMATDGTIDTSGSPQKAVSPQKVTSGSPQKVVSPQKVKGDESISEEPTRFSTEGKFSNCRTLRFNLRALISKTPDKVTPFWSHTYLFAISKV